MLPLLQLLFLLLLLFLPLDASIPPAIFTREGGGRGPLKPGIAYIRQGAIDTWYSVHTTLHSQGMPSRNTYRDPSTLLR